jgi:bifunctional ADP-heptose synthase (sugar kinase/adenylyltransferase)
MKDADVIVLSDYGKGGLTHIAAMIDRARAAGKRVLVDPKATITRAIAAPPCSRQSCRIARGRRPLER